MENLHVTQDNIQWVVQAIIVALAVYAPKIIAGLKSDYNEKIKSLENKSDKADEETKQFLDKEFGRIEEELEKKFNRAEEDFLKQKEMSRDMVKDAWTDIKEMQKRMCADEKHMAEEYVMKKDLRDLVRGIVKDG